MSPEAPDLDDVRALGLFAALDDAMVARWAATLPRRSHGEGEEVFREGEPGRSLFVVLEGEVELLRTAAPGRGTTVARLGKGEWFGEVALIGVTGRAVSVRTTAPTRLLVLSASELRELYRSDVKSYALLTMNIARGLARKLQRAETMLAQAMTRLGDDGGVSA